MSDITFSIQNPDSKPAGMPFLYLGKANTLNFTFSREGSGTRLQPGDYIHLSIPSNLLASATADQLNSPNWEVKGILQPSDQDPVYTYLLTPNISIDLSKPVTICFHQLQSLTIAMGDVSVFYTIGGRSVSGTQNKLSVLESPEQPGDLNDVLAFQLFINDDQDFVPEGKVYGSPTSLQPPIANSIHLNMKYAGQQLVSSWKAEHKPQFIVSFAYGSDSTALTNVIKAKDPRYNALTSAWNIGCGVDPSENDLWQILPPNGDDNGPNWVIQPTPSNLFLFSGDQPNLDVLFSHVISILPAGHTTIYIQWNYIPGYNGGVRALDIEKKVPDGSLLQLASPDNGQSILPGQSIVANWKVFNAGALSLFWDDGLRTKDVPSFDVNKPQLFYQDSDNSIIPDSPENDIYLFANHDTTQKSNPIHIKVAPFPPPAIKSFTGESKSGDGGSVEVALEWLVANLGNAGKFMLNDLQFDGSKYNGVKYNTSVTVSDPVFSKNFTLEAIDEFNGLKTSQSISVQIPKILQFSGEIERDAEGNATLLLSWQVLTLLECTYAINGVPCGGVNKQGQGNARYTINDASPLKRNYTLTMQCPGQTPITQTLNTHFAPKEVMTQSPAAGLAPTQLVLSHDGKLCVALFTKNNADHFYLAQFNPMQYDSIKYSNSYPTKGVCSMEPRVKLSFSPDSSQIFLGSNQVLCIQYKDGNFDPQLRIASPKNENMFYYSCAFMPDMSNVFMSVFNFISFCAPDPSLYTLPGSPPADMDDFIGGWLSNLWEIALSPDGKRLFAADSIYQRLWWVDTADLSVLTNYFKIADLQSLEIAENNWVYLVGGNAGDRGLWVGTFDAAGADYNQRFWVKIGTDYFSDMATTVSKDCSFFIVTDKYLDNLYLTSGATTAVPTVQLLQTLSVQAPGTAVIAQDNTRLFVPCADGIHVLEPIFV